MTYEFLQNYWWFIISLLGGLLVFLMFVQGGNVLLLDCKLNSNEKRMLLNSTGRKWELAFTTLVTFGGAFFASFPLFYSTSFSGAFWVWILLLFTFVFQAVSYEFHSKKGNLIGSAPFRVFLFINGLVAPLVVGAAVGTFFTGSNFTVNKNAILDGSGRAISAWGSAWHGLEALTEPLCIALGLTIVFLTIILGALYFIWNIEGELAAKMRKRVLVFTVPFLVCLVATLGLLLTAEGFAVDANGVVSMEKFKYLHNLIQMPAVLVMFLLGAVSVVGGIVLGAFTKSRLGIWPAGLGTVLVVISVFMLAGYNGTAYYPSTADLQSSLTIMNSSSSMFTLKSMFYISFAIPFVVAYIVYAWHQMDRKPITEKEIVEGNETKY